MSDVVYKVVLAVANPKSGVIELWSGCTDDTIRVQYQVGKRIYPVLEGSYLYAYDTLEAARKYIAGGELILYPQARLQIYKAYANVVCTEALTTFHNTAKFWEEQQYAVEMVDYPYGVCPPHEGAIWCEWVELIEMVEGLYPRFPNPPKKKKS